MSTDQRAEPVASAPAPVQARTRIRLGRSRGPAVAESAPPRVTVIITCFDYGRFLPGAVRSAVTQAGADVDVIVVDDCSTDDSADVARGLAAADPRVSLIALEENEGPVGAFNTGLATALDAADPAEFLVRLDADDLLTPGSLARAAELARAHPSVGLVYGHPLHFVDEARLPRHRARATAWTLWPGGEWVADRCADGRNVITSPEVLMRTSTVRRVGGQNDLAHTHDMEMWLRLAAFSDVGYVHGADQAWHRDHDRSLSSRKVDLVVDLEERRAAFDTLFAGPAGRLPWAGRASALVAQALDAEVLDLLEHELDIDEADGDTFARLRELAEQSGAEYVRRLAEIDRRGSRPHTARDRAEGLLRRARGRATAEIKRRRWHRRGEY